MPLKFAVISSISHRKIYCITNNKVNTTLISRENAVSLFSEMYLVFLLEDHPTKIKMEK